MQRVEIRHRPLPRIGYRIDESSLSEICTKLGFDSYQKKYDAEGVLIAIRLIGLGNVWTCAEGDIVTISDVGGVSGRDVRFFRPSSDEARFTFKALLS